MQFFEAVSIFTACMTEMQKLTPYLPEADQLKMYYYTGMLRADESQQVLKNVYREPSILMTCSRC